jgi:hypothetical protein
MPHLGPLLALGRGIGIDHVLDRAGFANPQVRNDTLR